MSLRDMGSFQSGISDSENKTDSEEPQAEERSPSNLERTLPVSSGEFLVQVQH